MTGLLRHRQTAVWAALVGATCLSWWLGADHDLGGGDGVTVATSLTLAIAFVKTRLIGMEFMELRGAPRPLRLAFEGWVAVVGATVVVLYVVGS